MTVQSRTMRWVLGGVALVALRAGATVIPVANGSFESPPVGAGLPVSLQADDWVLNGTGTMVNEPGIGLIPAGVGVFVNPANPGGTPPAPGQPYSNGHLDNVDASQVAYLFSNPGNSITTDPSSHPGTFAAGQQYTLTYSMALAENSPASTDRLVAELYYTDGTGDHVVAQRAVSLATDPSLNPQSMADFSVTTPLLAAGDAAVGEPISIGFFTVDNSSGEFDLDNVRLSSSVPEPVGLSALALGVTACLARRRRQA